jgi:hypothetical protein
MRFNHPSINGMRRQLPSICLVWITIRKSSLVALQLGKVLEGLIAMKYSLSA